MKTKSPLQICSAACWFALLLLATPGHAQIKIVMSNDNSALGLKGKTFELFRQEIAQRLGNKVIVELHHSGTLFNQKTQMQGVQLGGANFIAPGFGSFASQAPNINVLSIPFLLPSPDAINAAIDDPKVRQVFMRDLERKNLAVVGVWMNGPRDISSRLQKPILLPADLAGIKISRAAGAGRYQDDAGIRRQRGHHRLDGGSDRDATRRHRRRGADTECPGRRRLAGTDFPDHQGRVSL